MIRGTKELLKLTIFHTEIELRRLSLKPFHDHFKIIFTHGNEENGNPSQMLYYFWLRDHCRCGECINSRTFQKSYHILDIPLNVKPIQYHLEEKQLSVIWDDGHSSEFSLEWLKNVHQPIVRQREYFFWNKDTGSDIVDNSISLDEIKKNKTKCQIKLLKSLLKYGFAFIAGIEPTLNATENAITTFFPVNKTHFGDMWQVTNNYLHNDTAYTDSFLAPHTDNTYWTEAAGLIAFHMLSYEGTGGNTLLVDGFNAATNLKNNRPELYDTLTKNVIEWEYVDEGVHYSNIDHIIKHHPLTKDLWQIRVYDYHMRDTERAPRAKILKIFQRTWKEPHTRIIRAEITGSKIVNFT
ncbi:trimethyllysine dioxygenase, mitochondrial isoform X2 [Agrilus planipennis]|uniref:trimethyllysine dioxygenase n=1 Tax=Agrilus planipennis TaxID=224129 RepID=A0A1W4X4V5_AGRPL|nr:trimethyllysine dioxygenase, mitochondrial isoform X2 [Agrilus planipennis]XP_018331144.1 trimethyllysine dioxygenase, mitochondrial isoform X2 [Agrilus planipennis]XP_018331145.1 trimethyllysine dioxygenase, mitochondrial isoform X2 [Agrilus planipennis]XP_018331146.1 trimethyllysine dioxygenase, mitochondrial isoform X2 [Agrilus planipennis]XP_018331147.1 trimethyllysine dioxygenase, mitochondrial isoform X2 [Agrilus planipennis]XP_018331149.1 trimethyllysine dioxygenase, mitochondrial is